MAVLQPSLTTLRKLERDHISWLNSPAKSIPACVIVLGKIWQPLPFASLPSNGAFSVSLPKVGLNRRTLFGSESSGPNSWNLAAVGGDMEIGDAGLLDCLVARALFEVWLATSLCAVRRSPEEAHYGETLGTALRLFESVHDANGPVRANRECPVHSHRDAARRMAHDVLCAFGIAWLMAPNRTSTARVDVSRHQLSSTSPCPFRSPRGGVCFFQERGFPFPEMASADRDLREFHSRADQRISPLSKQRCREARLAKR